MFGNIFSRRRKVLARLRGIQKINQNGNSHHLHDLEEQLTREYNSILNQEEIFWFQKARTEWLDCGDRNIKYFHTLTRIKRKANKVEALVNEDG